MSPTERPADPREHDPLLDRAASSLRSEQDPGWEEAAQRVRATVRRTTRRARRVLATNTDLPADGGFRDGDRLAVSERVVIDVLRRTVSAEPAVAPVSLTLEVDTDDRGDARCVGVRCEVVVDYGARVPTLTARLRGRVSAALDDLLGPAERTVDLHVVDVEPSDPWP